MNQKFIVDELLRYYRHDNHDDIYRNGLKRVWQESAENKADPYRNAYKEALKKT
jgi:hypothetical protein